MDTTHSVEVLRALSRSLARTHANTYMDVCMYAYMDTRLSVEVLRFLAHASGMSEIGTLEYVLSTKYLVHIRILY
jgi:hypothetical protein